jgi:outer membrane protein assembly factor BamA
MNTPPVPRCHIGAAFLLAVLAVLPSVAGGGTAQEKEQTRPEIVALRFEGNGSIPAVRLQGQMVTRETPDWFNKFLFSLSEGIGRKNEYYDPVILAGDLTRLRKFYENRGFSDVRIDTTLEFSGTENTVSITVRITEGSRSLIEQVVYRGIPDYPEEIWKDIRGDHRIYPGDFYDGQHLEDEVRRVIRIFNDNGFPNARFVRDSSYARRYVSSRNYVVRLSFAPGRRFIFGDVTVVQEVDSLRGVPPRGDISEDLIFRQLDYQPGEFYSLQKKVSSERNLNRLGLFDLRQIETIVPANEDTSIRVATRIPIRPRDRHELAPELIVSDENGAFNLGVGLSYTIRNFLAQGFIFNPRIRFRTQTLGAFPDYFKVENEAVSNLDLTFELSIPYVFTNRMRGTWSFSAIVDKQVPYLQNILRNKFSLSGRFAEYTSGFVVWTLEAVDLRLNRYALEPPIDQETIQRLLALEPRQLNSILSVTLQRDRTNDPFSPTEGFIHSVTGEESGFLPLLFREAFRSDLPYTQFVRGIVVGRWYRDFSGRKFAIVAYKAKVGIEGKYGESASDASRQIPQTHRFFGGGGTSVRGWGPRALLAKGNPEFGGNLSLEGSAEIRTNIFQSAGDGLLDKLWLVQFVDAGNVWPLISDFQVKTVAIAAGIGFRYDTFFGPFRLDWGIRIYDPLEPNGNNWITQRRLFADTFKNGVFHFGIGHAF